MQIPLFPLNAVVMPGGLLPLRLFEPRYLDMVRDCLRIQTGFGICLVKDGQEVGKAATPFPHGTLIKIVDWDQADNGLFQIVVEGDCKFRIVDTTVNSADLLLGEVELLPAEQSTEVLPAFQHLVPTMRQMLERAAPLISYEHEAYDDALWLGSRFVELLPLASDLRHELLLMNNPLERLTIISEVWAALERNANESQST